GLPVNQKTGEFPVAAGSEAYAYDRNPNRISEHLIHVTLPAMPQAAKQPSCLPMGPVGVTLTGVALFNGLDGMGRDAAAHEVQDRCSGHPQRQGHYHYHSWSACIPDAAGEGEHSVLVAYALDGFGIFGPRGDKGKRLSNEDLDACHGHTHAIAWDGQEVVMYHYHFTDEYPYALGCFVGTPVAFSPAR
ncbi:MAG: YHYH protein, partial [Rickettsiales bacterium]|nr:YHYH protein [Rickettsiales bacterium]